ncbi:3-dehydroquinate synthase [Faecalicoccus pleomorphus]|uniref:3-dehydroquinate synthase n=1 Tax=Faecalicoccus pleomorphus TaxID=1323 RepID=UPI0025A3B4A6|nr:3-dehydroquinate synthase [Faecalicoccus pleomorphus]MDM8292639.1 3-dehydroquinate synthase [Faecalicoccus pleomorphus]
MKMTVNLKDRSYPILIESGALSHIDTILDVNRKLALIADDAIPKQWIQKIKDQCPNSFVIRFPQGEASKCFSQYEDLLKQCIDHDMTRKDAIVAIGGGVTGDLAGFVASSYMRGIDFYNIPTTLLAQVDSSVGGKVAIDVASYKNIVGAFHQPKGVIIDPDVLSTLSQRQIHNGLVEALKTGLIQDEKLVELFEQDTLDIPQIIERSINVKRQVVEQDEKESGLRKILNFGHTIGHAIEGAYGLDTYLHGECVAMGMLFFIEDQPLKERVLSIYKRLDLPKVPDYDIDILMSYIQHDKKSSAHTVSIVKVRQAGTFEIEEMTYEQIRNVLERGPYEK